uniref:Uncharacterized protein n=1 Tax=Daphnia galeata TaxID=27404 RepID=A0A8J2RF24_9CRUS|nr:unnamed protein product [Daphnia galeata]
MTKDGGRYRGKGQARGNPTGILCHSCIPCDDFHIVFSSVSGWISTSPDQQTVSILFQKPTLAYRFESTKSTKLRTMSDYYEEACYLSNSEAEPDSENEDSVTKPVIKPELTWDDPQALLNTWLGELDNLNMVSHDLLPVLLQPIFGNSCDWIPSPGPMNNEFKIKRKNLRNEGKRNQTSFFYLDAKTMRPISGH